MSLYLVRHGHTRATEDGIAAGRSDVPLNENGRKAISALGAELSSLVPGRDLDWWASPLHRTRESAALLQSASGLTAPVICDERLVELDFGIWEGQSWADIHRDHEAAMSHWAEDWIHHAPPGGECFADQQARCESWLADWRAGGQADSPPRDTVAVVHGGTIRALVCTLLGWPPARAMSFSVDPASLFQCRFDAAAGAWRAVRFNQRATPQLVHPASNEV